VCQSGTNSCPSQSSPAGFAATKVGHLLEDLTLSFLRDAFDRDASHRGGRCRFGNRFCICGIILLAFYISFNVLLPRALADEITHLAREYDVSVGSLTRKALAAFIRNQVSAVRVLAPKAV
jgi:hypothetical protein